MMKEKITTLKNDIAAGRWTPSSDCEEWGGADLIITSSPIVCDGKVIVETAYSRELSSLVCELRDRLVGHIDYMSKYEFYPRLGGALNTCLAKGNYGLESLVEAMMTEALQIAEDWENKKI